MPVPLLEIIAKKRILDKKIKELKKVIVIPFDDRPIFMLI
jgi:hypothetical protein